MSGSNIPMYGEGIDFATAYTVSTSTPEYPGAPLQVGTRVTAGNGGQWIFVLAAGSITANDLVAVTVTSTWSVAALSNTNAKGFLGRLVGKAGATATSGQYLWMQVAGYAAAVNAATGSTAYTVLSSSATGGRIAAASAGNSAKVTGLVIQATAASNTSTAILNFPAVGTDD